MNKEELSKRIDENSSELFHLSDKIWNAAELAFNENISAAALCKVLEKHEFEVSTGLADIETAFCGKFGDGKPIIGFLGEFDALSNLSQVAGCTYKKEEIAGGNGHGCGHNLLGAGSLSAAIAVKEYLKETGKSGTVIYFGCPGEEGGSGKAFMARDGVFDQLDVALGWHPGDMNSVTSGSSLANIQVIYRFHGVSAHAAGNPHMGKSALDAVELTDIGANYLREHIISEARIHYAITNSGGKFPGVVQQDAEVVYLIRAPKVEQVQDIYERVNDIARGAALMTGTTVDIDFVKACSNVVPNTVLEKVVQTNLNQTPVATYNTEELKFASELYQTTTDHDEYLLQQASALSEEEYEEIYKYRGKVIYDFVMPYIHSETAFSASTDVGDVSHVCPTVQMSAASWVVGTSPHSWQATTQGKSSIAHKSILFVGKVLSSTAVDLIEQPSLLEAAKAEHNKRTGGSFISPIPPNIEHRKRWY